MQESVIYQDILQKGLQQGIQQGRQEGEATLIVRLLNRRFGNLDPQIQQRVHELSTNQLENLAEALLDFSSLTDLINYLAGISTQD